MKQLNQLNRAIGLAIAKGVSGKKIEKVLAGAGLSMASVAAMAAGPDFTALTAGVDFSTLIAAVMAIAVLGVGYVLAKGGASGIVGFISKMARGS